MIFIITGPAISTRENCVCSFKHARVAGFLCCNGRPRSSAINRCCSLSPRRYWTRTHRPSSVCSTRYRPPSPRLAMRGDTGRYLLFSFDSCTNSKSFMTILHSFSFFLSLILNYDYLFMRLRHRKSSRLEKVWSSKTRSLWRVVLGCYRLRCLCLNIL